ncbi:MAG: T9SS type A sorting domain-containing protein, partial [Chitinophagales bacterium]|nr:T9SS type A sorting domain-containing protein [Chitinophagales bacterium]
QINTITAAQTGARSAAASPSNAVAKGTEVHLSDLEIVLNQNSPNPFAEQTIISYIIPDNVKDANIVFYTLGGTVLKNIRINERGQGQMTVYAENLSAGMYTYSLVADGNIVATKKMICEKK